MTENITRIRKHIKRYLPLILLVGVGTAVFFLIRARSGGSAIETEVVQYRTIIKTITASGNTSVEDMYTQRAQIGGLVKALKYSSGDEVKKGDVIIIYDSDSLKAGMEQAYTAYLSAKSDFESYDQSLKSAKATQDIRKRERDEAWREYMADNSEDNKQAYKNAEALYQTATTTVVSLENSKDSIKKAVDSYYSSYVSSLNTFYKTEVTSPASGRLALNDINVGSLIVTGQELFSISGAGKPIFKAEIDETDVSHLSVGMPAKVTLDSYPDRVFEGKVLRLDAKVITLLSGSTVVMADIEFEAEDIVSILGMNGSVDIEYDKKDDLLSVSPEALFEEVGSYFVFKVVNGTAVKQEVDIAIEGDLYTGISSGLSADDIVILNPLDSNITDGLQVNI